MPAGTPMNDAGTLYTLRCGDMAAQISSRGAELVSLQKAGREFLWQGDPASWDAHSPLLFPLVGRTNDDYFTVDGTRYEADIHGFARCLSWDVHTSAENTVTLELVSGEKTMPLYPFEFRLESRFSVQDDEVCVERTVANTGKHTMPYFIGEHPGFSVPLLANGEFDACCLAFEQAENASRYFHDGKLLTGEAAYGHGFDKIPITRALFQENPFLLLSGLRSRSVTLYAKGRKVVRLSIEGFDYLAIWTHSQASAFVCLEPWRGIPSFVGSSHELCEKRGVRLLASGHSETYRYDIHVFSREGTE